MTKDEIRAEIERLENEYREIEALEADTYRPALNVFFEAYREAHMSDDEDYRQGLIAAWPHMPETVALKAELAALKGAMAMKGFAYDAEHSTLKLREEYLPNVWHDWHGGKCPVDGHMQTEMIMRAERPLGPCSAGEVRWSHMDNPGDIIRFRILPD